MTVAIIETAPIVVLAIDDLAIVPGLAILTPAVNDSALLLKFTNALLQPNCIPYIYHLWG